MTHLAIRFVLPCVLAFASLGCMKFVPPRNFVELEDQESYELRATNSQGVVVAVRAFGNEPEGSQEFWTDAIRTRLRDVAGYAILEEKPARAASGEHGIQLRCGRDENSRPYLYWITIFVTEDNIYILEAGGRRDRFEPVQTEVENAINAFRTS